MAVPRKPIQPITEPKISVVDFSFNDRTYQIDPSRRKVYRQFVEIETSRASEIFSSWRAHNARV